MVVRSYIRTMHCKRQTGGQFRLQFYYILFDTLHVWLLFTMIVLTVT